MVEVEQEDVARVAVQRLIVRAALERRLSLTELEHEGLGPLACLGVPVPRSSRVRITGQRVVWYVERRNSMLDHKNDKLYSIIDHGDPHLPGTDTLRLTRTHIRTVLPHRRPATGRPSHGRRASVRQQSKQTLAHRALGAPLAHLSRGANQSAPSSSSSSSSSSSDSASATLSGSSSSWSQPRYESLIR